MKPILILILILTFITTPAQARRVQDRGSVEVNVPYHLSLEIHLFIDEVERIALVDAEGLAFTEEMILDAMAQTPFWEEAEVFGFVVDHEDPIEVVTFGNMPHELLLSSDLEAFQGPDGAMIPVERLEWRRAGEEWQPVTTENDQVFERRTPGLFRNLLEFRLWLTIEDAVGAYAGDLVFTLAGI